MRTPHPEPPPGPGGDPAADIASVFARDSGDRAFAALHRLLGAYGAQRFTIASLGRDVANPIQYHYHEDLEGGGAAPLDAQTLAFALASDQRCELPPAVGVQSIDRASRRLLRRLTHAVVAPIRVGGAHLGFCLVQSDDPPPPALGAMLDYACVLIGQELEIAREAALGQHGAKSLGLLLETARALSSGLDLVELFAKFHSLVGRVMDASLFVAALLTPDGEHLEIQYNAEFGHRSTEKIRLPLTTVAGEVLKSGQPIIVRQPEDWNTLRTVTLGETDNPASALIVPMRLGERVLGVLSVQSPRPYSYTRGDCDLLTAVSEQAALAIENLRNLAASTQRAADLNLLVEVARAVSSELDLHRVFAKIHEQVRRVIDAPLFLVALRSGQGEKVTLEYLVEGDRVFPSAEHPAVGTIVGRVMVSGEPVLVRTARERDALSMTRVGGGPGTVRSVLAVPMTIGGRAIGVLSTQSYEEGAYDERHLRLLCAIAEQSAVAVHNAKLYERTKELAENDALTGLAHQRSVQERLTYELKRARRSGGKVSLLMMDVDRFKAINDTYGHPAGDRILKETAALLRRVARDTDIVGRYGGDEFCVILPETDRAAALSFVERLTSEVARRPFAIDDEHAIPIRLSIGLATYPDECRGRDDLIGAADEALYAAKRGDAEQALDVEALVASLAGDVRPFAPFIAALANARRGKREQLTKVNRLAERYAAGANIGGRERDTLLVAAALADIGELAIPSLIVTKPGRLSPEDYAIIKRHPELGYRMLASLKGCEDVALVIRHHQERYDGSGYPDGLRGDDIPMLSRILAVLDAYAAMTSDRPYRTTRTHEQALDELRACAGTQFDPRVVEVFCRLAAGEPDRAPANAGSTGA